MGNVLESKERVFDLSESEGTPRLTIHHLNGDITVRTWDRPQIRFQIEEDDVDIEDVFGFQQHGNEIGVNMEWSRDRHARFHDEITRQIESAFREGDFSAIGDHIGAFVGRFVGPRLDVDLEIKVPPNCDIAVHTTSGDIDIEGVTGNIYLETTNGDITLNEVTANVIGKSASGGFDIQRFNGRLGLRTASGDVNVTAGLLQAFNIGTVSGDVELSGALAPDGEYAVRTTSGDVQLALPADTRCTVKIRTVSGDVECELPFERQREGRRHMTLDINGGGPALQFASVSGDLEIVRLDRTAVATREAPAPTMSADEDDADADHDATQRLRRDDAPDVINGESARVEGGAPTGPLAADAPAAPRRTAEMDVLEAIERGEMSVDEGLQRLAELRNTF